MPADGICFARRWPRAWRRRSASVSCSSMGGLHALSLKLADAIEDVLDIVLGKWRVAMAGIPVVDQGRDEPGVEGDGAQELPRNFRDFLVAILGELPFLVGGPLRGVMTFAA